MDSLRNGKTGKTTERNKAVFEMSSRSNSSSISSNDDSELTFSEDPSDNNSEEYLYDDSLEPVETEEAYEESS